jgi:histidine triad (HIT) family protein
MEDCIFCKIASNEIKSTKIYEDNSFFAFLDLNPVSKGHVLIVPKSHSRWIHEAENNIISEIFILSKLIINKKRKRTFCHAGTKAMCFFLLALSYQVSLV